MKDIANMQFNPTAEKIVDVICKKTQNSNRLFFRVLVAYYLTKITSMMRINIKTHERGIIPINLYAINLAQSGHGKGYSSNIMEDTILGKFRERFLQETFENIAQINLKKLARYRAAKKNTDEDVELIATETEFKNLGELLFSFDSGTVAAVKQMRQKLLMANAGSMNMEIDEIGSNLLGNVDVLKAFFELFDIGKIKQKLVKNTSENVRSAEITGNTPTNMLLFGTPSKLLDGGKVEEETMSMLEAGMARRCFFGIDSGTNKNTSLTANEVYDLLTDVSTTTFIDKISSNFLRLADPVLFGGTLEMSKAVSLLIIEYKLECEKQANDLPLHESIRFAEISHRYFKMLKLAGTYAYIESSPDILEEHVYNAIKLTEESGEALKKLLMRDRNYVRLAKYIASIEREVTYVDLLEDLPFFKGSEAQRREMMNLAVAYGYKNNIIIKKTFRDNIEFLEGQALKTTNLNKLSISYSTDIAKDYINQFVPFDKLHKLTQTQNYHWCAHHLLDGHRKDDNIIPGFNLVVLDVDGGVNINTVELLLRDYTYLIYTTKRHTDVENRFRVILPMSHTLNLDKSEYTEFMHNVYEWVPFDVDTATSDRCRKWLSCQGKYLYNKGDLLDSLLFIPKTAKNDERKKFVADHQSLSNMERWFCNNTNLGNRSNQLIKYALLLVDTGMDFANVQSNVLSLNSKLKNKMSEAEILSTILVTTAKAIAKRDA